MGTYKLKTDTTHNLRNFYNELFGRRINTTVLPLKKCQYFPDISKNNDIWSAVIKNNEFEPSQLSPICLNLTKTILVDMLKWKEIVDEKGLLELSGKGPHIVTWIEKKREDERIVNYISSIARFTQITSYSKAIMFRRNFFKVLFDPCNQNCIIPCCINDSNTKRFRIVLYNYLSRIASKKDIETITIGTTPLNTLEHIINFLSIFGGVCEWLRHIPVENDARKILEDIIFMCYIELKRGDKFSIVIMEDSPVLKIVLELNHYCISHKTVPTSFLLVLSYTNLLNITTQRYKGTALVLLDFQLLIDAFISLNSNAINTICCEVNSNKKNQLNCINKGYMNILEYT